MVPMVLQGTSTSQGDLMEAVRAAAAAAGQLAETQQDLADQVGRSKADVPMPGLPDSAAFTRISTLGQQKVADILSNPGLDGAKRGQRLEAAKMGVLDALRSAGAVRSEASSALTLPMAY